MGCRALFPMFVPYVHFASGENLSMKSDTGRLLAEMQIIACRSLRCSLDYSSHSLNGIYGRYIPVEDSLVCSVGSCRCREKQSCDQTAGPFFDLSLGNI